jgi:hypothetical protein
MKKQILSAVIILCMGIGIGYVFPHKQHLPKNSILIIPTDNVDKQQNYSVLFEDDKQSALDYLHADDIARGLLTNNWDYSNNVAIPLVSLNP